jgi:CDP-diacylglycerol--glycerol-3-phosphate 3-phosphatidyltransferase
MWRISLKEALNTEIDSQQSADSKEVTGDKLKGTRFLSHSVKDFWVMDLMRPIENYFVRHKITPNKITMMGLAISILAGICFATNHLIWAGWLIIWAGCCDFFDGRVARRMNLQTEEGSFLDSVMDRYMDAASLFGLAWLFRDSWMLWVVYLAILGSFTTPYIRAKSESLKIDCKGGEMQRPERIVYIGVGSMMSGYILCLSYPFLPAGAELPPYLLMAGVIIVAYQSNKVALQRFLSTYNVLKSGNA